ncbi:Sir2 family histone deacetylase Hst2 [Lyophyllum atratum]|nr:Sir2 family histone deacetylase Hst2 [Lyophyllum atratum]
MGNNPKSPSSPKGGHPQASRESQRTQDIRKLAAYIQSEKCKNIVLMLGAGCSTSSGIPDFRSPKTGLYSNLARLKLPHPEAVFEINFFRRNPVPFYTLAAELYPGNFRPSPTHSFVKLLSSHGLLKMCFTQNIDTLERRAGVPSDKIIEAHGSFAEQRCVDCKTPFPDDEMRDIVLGDRPEAEEVRIPRCKRAKCGGLVKPDIVFFGEALPENFIRNIPVVGYADLLLIIGTSLTVHPFASLANMADRRTCQRVLINLETVGDLGRRPNDIVLLGECDAIVRELCEALGWGEELERTWAETALDGKTDEAKEKLEEKVEDEEKEKEEREEVLEHEVEKITESIGKRLDLDETKDSDADAAKGSFDMSTSAVKQGEPLEQTPEPAKSSNDGKL